MIAPRTSCLRVLGACLTGILLSACNVQRSPEPEAAAQATPTLAKAWSDIPVSSPENRVTIHYHRQDGSYYGVNLWTWDPKNNAPKGNSVAPIGRDDFGAVFQIDRGNYGGAEKIGIIPRIGQDWALKDGSDKFWTTALGNEIWLVNKKEDVFTQRPDISVHIQAAYIDAPDRIVVRLTGPAPRGAKVFIVDQNNADHATNSTSEASPEELAVTPDEPLNTGNLNDRIRVEGCGDAAALTPRGLLDDRELYFDEEARLGATYAPQGTTFRIFAPTATAVNLVLYDAATGNKGRTMQGLELRPKGLWDVTISGDLRGTFYTYVLDGPGLSPAREVLDPYAVNAVSGNTRARVTDLGPAPRPGPRVESATDMVIYEMHVRDFTVSPTSGANGRGLYPGFGQPFTRVPGDAQIRTALDHLSELGVTHVQIMPVQDYENESGKYNWGYIPMDYFSPEGMYATNPDDDSRVRELKGMIDALHSRGIGVIMDVVYNHTAENAPLQAVAPGYYYRHLADGSLANGSACGNELRTEAPMARKLILDSLKLWVKEYGVDGFRFDLMALIDQETMREAESELRAINPNIVLYGEPWMAGASPLRETTDKTALRGMGPIGAFNDDFRNALHGPPEGSEPGWIQNGSNREALEAAMLVSDWFAEPGQSINYMTCHDNLVLWDKLKISMPGAGDPLLKETMKLGYLVLFTSQGVPFIQGGEEFARSKGGNNNSYDAPDSVNEVDWSLKRRNLDLFNYTRDVIALRKEHPVFRLRSREEIAKRLSFQDTPDEKSLMFTLDGAGVPGEMWRRVCVVLNSDDGANADLALPPGQWTVALDERGASMEERTVSGIVSVRQKSGLVLYQQ